MKKILILFLIIASKDLTAQDMILPGDKIFESKWVKEQHYDMQWFMIRDTMKKEMGVISTAISIKNNKYYITQEVKMKKSNGRWIDSTVAESKTFAPVYHSSYNTDRNMVLNYNGQNITGYRLDNEAGRMDIIKDSTTSLYFDSNIYTYLLSWLPLKEGYTAKFPIYDYNSSKKHGVVYITVNAVSKGKLLTAGNVEEEVFIVDITDGITNANSTFYISVKNRQQLKMTAAFGPNKIELVRVQ